MIYVRIFHARKVLCFGPFESLVTSGHRPRLPAWLNQLQSQKLICTTDALAAAMGVLHLPVHASNSCPSFTELTSLSHNHTLHRFVCRVENLFRVFFVLRYFELKQPAPPLTVPPP
jgi:hypothetical protein